MSMNSLFDSNPRTEETIDMEDVHHTDTRNDTTSPTRSPPPAAWGQGKKLFTEMLSDDAWYVAESDS
ncbi:unnamed protein product [Linum trigynum]|uniref:Uncharacterized protein n=1 Tax=Linum trigynum TaxID=586398 RepID=A0AAV2CLW2_9ROSI